MKSTLNCTPPNKMNSMMPTIHGFSAPFGSRFLNTGKNAYSNEYVNILFRLNKELSKVDSIVDLLDIPHHLNKAQFSSKEDFINYHKASVLISEKLLIRNSMSKVKGIRKISNGPRITYVLGTSILPNKEVSRFSHMWVSNRYHNSTTLIDKALLICPTTDLMELTRIATTLEKCDQLLTKTYS